MKEVPGSTEIFFKKVKEKERSLQRGGGDSLTSAKIVKLFNLKGISGGPFHINFEKSNHEKISNEISFMCMGMCGWTSSVAVI